MLVRPLSSRQALPGEWAATGGAAVSGEDSFTAAKRELFEELGIKSDRESLKRITRIKRRSSLLDVWAIVCDIPESELVLQRSEVAEAKWVSKEELCKMIKGGSFHNYGKEYFNCIFEK